MKARIYGVKCNITGEVYIGSTELTLKRRLQKHESALRSYEKGTRKTKCSIDKILNRGDYYIYLIEEFECNTKEEKYAKETHYQTTMECINVYKAQAIQDDKTNYQKYKEQYKEYYENNKEKLLAYAQNYNKAYYEKHKDRILTKMKSSSSKAAYRKEYYEKNKQKILEQQKVYKKVYNLKKKEINKPIEIQNI